MEIKLSCDGSAGHMLKGLAGGTGKTTKI